MTKYDYFNHVGLACTVSGCNTYYIITSRGQVNPDPTPTDLFKIKVKIHRNHTLRLNRYYYYTDTNTAISCAEANEISLPTNKLFWGSLQFGCLIKDSTT